MRIIIPGNPIPKARHRHMFRNGKYVVYDPQQELKNYFKLSLLSAMNEKLHSENRSECVKFAQDSTFHVDLTFHINPPSSLSQNERKCVLWGFKMIGQKPDIDNLVKFVLDAMNHTIFNDDKAVVSITAKKIYSLQPQTVIEIKEIKPMLLPEKQKEIALVFDLEKVFKFLNDCEKLKFAYDMKNIEQIIDITKDIAKKYSSDLTKIKKILS